MEPKDSQGHSGGRQENVSASQHGQKDIHGLMEGAFTQDNKDEGSVSQDCCDVHETKRDRKPGVVLLQAWDSK